MGERTCACLMLFVDLGSFVEWSHVSESEDGNSKSLFNLERTNNLFIIRILFLFFNSSYCWQPVTKDFKL